MAEEEVSTWPAIAGFSVVSGTMIVALAVLLQRAPPPMPWAEADAEVAAEETEVLPRVYVPLTHMLTIALRENGPRMEAGLALAVRGSAEDLLKLNSMVEARIGPIEAEVVRAAQEVVASSAESNALHAELPERLRAVINQQIGSDDWPAPVEEVLITSLEVR
ncbi:MAG: hypothetical protein C0427_12105 [Rhodobacter sp.]|nr:hypothetical protein [Rhodobacter sp.]